jgi:microsomal dipeptidase-like Zn-dependent dipeptidase
MRSEHAFLVALLALMGCASVTPPSPDPGPLAPCTPDPLEGEPAVWGWADLHTHPGIEVAFEQRLVWGSALQHVDEVSPTELPAIDPPCSVETHHHDTASPLERTAHQLVMSMLNGQAQYLHSPIGTLHPDSVHLDAWPDGRDVLHQQMQLSSLRRAYEGGQRVLIASTTDSQVLSQLLKGPLFPDLFRPSSTYDEDSAARQLALIRRMVSEQSGWMAIAESPADARHIIESGRLAVILSLEMDGLTRESILRLVASGVRHVIPVHVIDNQHGGSAAYGDIFNPSTAYMTELFHPDQRLTFFEVDRTSDVLFSLPRPILGASGPSVPVYAELDPIPFDWYERLAYDDTCICTTATPQPIHAWAELGHANAHGLSDDGRALVRELLSQGVMVDVSHMGLRSTEDAICAAHEVRRPLMASHGGVGPVDGPVGTERDLSRASARRLAATGGLLGLGTGGFFDERALLVQTAAPLASLRSVHRGASISAQACVEDASAGAPSGSCAVPVETTLPPGGLDLERVDVRLVPRAGTTCTPTQRAYAQIALTPPGTTCGSVTTTSVNALFVPQPDGSCLATALTPIDVREASGAPVCDGATVPRSFTTDSVCSIGIGWTNPTTCLGANDGSIAIDSATATLTTPSGELTIARGTGAPWIAGQGISLYAPHGTTPEVADRSMIRIDVVIGGPELPGADAASDGYDLCARLRTCVGAGCTCAPSTVIQGDSDCGDGWISLNHRGDWPAGNEVDEYVHLPAGTTAGEICGVDLALVGDGPIVPMTIGQVRLDAIDDPIALWAELYDSLESDLFPTTQGHIAFGTDMDGLAPQFPTALESPDDTFIEANGCATPHLARMTVRGAPLRLEDRGMGTYGMLADVVGTIAEHPGGRLADDVASRVTSSLFYSAEQLLRFWERVDGTRPTPDVAMPECGP